MPSSRSTAAPLWASRRSWSGCSAARCACPTMASSATRTATSCGSRQAEQPPGVAAEDGGARVVGQIEAGELGEQVGGVEHRDVGAEEELVPQPALHVADDLVGQ